MEAAGADAPVFAELLVAGAFVPRPDSEELVEPVALTLAVVFPASTPAEAVVSEEAVVSAEEARAVVPFAAADAFVCAKTLVATETMNNNKHKALPKRVMDPLGSECT